MATITTQEENDLLAGINADLPDTGKVIYTIDERNAIWRLYTLMKTKFAETSVEKTWAEVVHTHVIGDVTGLAEKLADIDAKVAAIDLRVTTNKDGITQLVAKHDTQQGEIAALQQAIADFNNSTSGGITVVDTLTETRTGFALDATRGKELNDRLNFLQALIQTYTGGGSSTGTDNIYWIVRPHIEYSPTTRQATIIETEGTVTYDTPVANWNNVSVPFAFGTIPYTFPALTTGQRQAFAIVGNSNKIWEIVAGDLGSDWVLPTNLGNRVLGGYLLLGESGGTVVEPDSTYVTQEQYDFSGYNGYAAEPAGSDVSLWQSGTTKIKASWGQLKTWLTAIYDLRYVPKANPVGDGSLFWANDNTYKAPAAVDLTGYLKKTEDADIILRRVTQEYVNVLADRIRTGFSTGGGLYTGNYSVRENFVTATTSGTYTDILFKKDVSNHGRILIEEYAGGNGAVEKRDRTEAKIINSANEVISGYSQVSYSGDLNAVTTDAAGVITSRKNIIGKFDYAEVFNETTGEKSQAQAMLSASTEEGRAEAKVSYTHTNPDGTSTYHEWTLDINGFRKNGKRILTEDDLLNSGGEKFIPAQPTAPTAPTDRQKWIDNSVTPPVFKYWDATLATPAWVSVGGGGSVIASTDELKEGTTNLYFTAARAIGSALTGYAKATVKAAIAATDTVLQALGKLEYRIETLEAGGGTTGSYLPLTGGTLQTDATGKHTLSVVGITGQTGNLLNIVQLAADTHPRVAIGVDGRILFGPPTAAADAVLERNAAGNIRISNTLSVNSHITTNRIENPSNNANSQMRLENTGAEFRTGVTGNVGLIVQNSVSNATGDLQRWLQGTAVRVKVTSSGTVDAANYLKNGVQAFVDQTHMAPSYLANLYDVPATEITKLKTEANWTGRNYTGTAIANTLQGQKHDDGVYLYECVQDNKWIRI